jgi:hypothetical protein
MESIGRENAKGATRLREGNSKKMRKHVRIVLLVVHSGACDASAACAKRITQRGFSLCSHLSTEKVQITGVINRLIHNINKQVVPRLCKKSIENRKNNVKSA